MKQSCDSVWQIERKKSPTSVLVLPLAYGGRVFARKHVRERSGWQRVLKLDCSAPKVICSNSVCVTSPIEEHCSKQQWRPFQLKVSISVWKQAQYVPAERSLE